MTAAACDASAAIAEGVLCSAWGQECAAGPSRHNTAVQLAVQDAAVLVCLYVT